jgi:hypothetical protein
MKKLEERVSDWYSDSFFQLRSNLMALLSWLAAQKDMIASGMSLSAADPASLQEEKLLADLQGLTHFPSPCLLLVSCRRSRESLIMFCAVCRGGPGSH